MAQRKLWIVLPAYNEELALPRLLDSLIEEISEEGKQYSILVVNDGSKDRTGAIAEEYSKKFPVVALHNDGNKGLAETIRHGLTEAVKRSDSKDIIITMDADDTHPAGLALRMSRLVREGNDVVIASRYQPGAHVRGLALHRELLSIGASWLFRIMFPIHGVKDYTCGYRAYRASVMKKLVAKYGQEFVSAKGFSCMVDILLRLREDKDLVFAEVPLILRYDKKPSASKMKVFATVVETLTLLVKRKFSGK